MHDATNYEWLASNAAIQIWKDMHSTGDVRNSHADVLANAPNRKPLLALIKEQWELSQLAKSKFPTPEKWFWTRTLLEQSSDAWCAEETSRDFPENAEVVDVCCGAGADTLALASRCRSVRGIDLSPTSVSLLKANATLQGQRVEIVCGPAEDTDIRSEEYLHIDPDRRHSGKRVTAIDGFDPSWTVIHRLIKISKGTSLKVAPATDWTELELPPDTIRFLSRDRSVRQQRWLWELDRWPAASIVISVFARNSWAHEVFDRESDHDSYCEAIETELPGSYVADYDPVIRAARVSAKFAARIGARMLDRAGGYLTAAKCEPHEMVRWFRVLDVLSMDSKKLRAYARSAQIGAWELKSRGVTVDLDKIRKELPTAPDSSKLCTLLFSKIAGRPRVIAAEPLGGWGIPLSN